jgi:hypothetical protein
MTPMRFSRVKIESDFRELEKITAAAVLRGELIAHRLPGVARGHVSAPLVMATPKQQPVEPHADE